MNVREKLVELLKSVLPNFRNNMAYWGEKPIYEFADCLLANSVTVQEWIPVTERLPKDGVRVLALHDDGIIRIGISRGYFPSIVSRTNTKSFGIAEVTHWMPLPEMPKGE